MKSMFGYTVYSNMSSFIFIFNLHPITNPNSSCLFRNPDKLALIRILFSNEIIFNETIFLIDEKMNQIFSCKILTDQFVKTKSEFEKFKKLLNN